MKDEREPCMELKNESSTLLISNAQYRFDIFVAHQNFLVGILRVQKQTNCASDCAETYLFS